MKIHKETIASEIQLLIDGVNSKEQAVEEIAAYIRWRDKQKTEIMTTSTEFNNEGIKDKVDHFKSLDDKGKKEYLDTLKNKWIPETEKQLKGAKSDAAKKIYGQQLKFEKEKLLPAIEKEYKNSGSNDLDKQLDRFRDIAKKAKIPKEFIKEVRNIKDVPPEVANYFSETYGTDSNGKQLSMEETAKKFMQDNKMENKDFKEGDDIIINKQNYKYNNNRAKFIGYEYSDMYKEKVAKIRIFRGAKIPLIESLPDKYLTKK